MSQGLGSLGWKCRVRVWSVGLRDEEVIFGRLGVAQLPLLLGGCSVPARVDDNRKTNVKRQNKRANATTVV